MEKNKEEEKYAYPFTTWFVLNLQYSYDLSKSDIK